MNENNSLFLKNLKALEQSGSPLFESLSHLKENKDFKIIPCSREGFYLQTPSLALNSKVNSLKECEQIVEKNWQQWQSQNTIVICGLELGYLTLKLLKEMEPHQSIWVFEKEPIIVKLAFSLHDFAEFIISQKVRFFVPSHLVGLEAYFQTLALHQTQLYIHRASYHYDPSFYEALKKAFTYIFSLKLVNENTIGRFENLWIKNIIGNLDSYIHFKGLDILFETLKDVSAIVVGAGPSLTKQIPSLKRIKDCVCIICASTALNILIENDIIPHIVVSVDPQVQIFYHFISLLQNKNKISHFPLLVAESTIQPLITRNYQGQVLFSDVSLLKDLIYPIHGQKAKLDAGGSVITLAYSLAIFLKAQKIILIGSDLAFSENTMHFKGSELEKNWYFHKQNRFEPLETWHYNYTKKKQTLTLPGFFGKPVKTDLTFQTYKEWLENRFSYYAKAFPTFNCTEGGVFFRNIPNLSFKEVLNDTFQNPIPETLSFLQQDFTNPLYLKELEQFKHIFKDLLSHFDCINQNIDKALPLYEKIHRLLRQERPPAQSDLDLIQKLDEDIIKQTNNLEILSLNMQKTLNKIEAQKEDLFNEKEKANPHLQGLKKSMIIYESLKESILFCREILTHFLALHR
jgi:hypothetical protein